MTEASALPYSDEAEKAILSVLMQSPHRAEDISVELREEHFYNPINRLLFQTLLRCHAEGRPMDLVGLSHYMIQVGMIDKVGGPATLTEIYAFIPTTGHYVYYRDILLREEKIRSFLLALEDARKNTMELGHEDPLPLIQSTQDAIGEILKGDSSKKDESFKEQLVDYIDSLEARILGETETAIPTRWRRWNKVFGGITPTMWMIRAFPASGKSSLAQNMVEDVLASGKEVLWYSYEMGKMETIDRMVCAKARIPSEKVFFPKGNPMNNEEVKHVMSSIRSMLEQKLHLRCNPTWTVEQIVVETRRMKRKHPNLALVVIDYLQIIPTKKDFGAKRSDQVAYISRTIKRDIQAANEVACVILSQLNDDGKTLDSRAPEQDCSCIVTIEKEHTEVVRGKSTTYPAGVRVNKNRNLPSGELLKLKLNGQFFTFEEYHPETVQQ